MEAMDVIKATKVIDAITKIRDTIKCIICRDYLKSAVKIHCCYVCEKCATTLCEKGQPKDGGLKCPQCRTKVIKRNFSKNEFYSLNVEKAVSLISSAGLMCSDDLDNDKDFEPQFVSQKNRNRYGLTVDTNGGSKVKYVNVGTHPNLQSMTTSTPTIAGLRPALTANLTPVLPSGSGNQEQTEKHVVDGNNVEEAFVFKKPMIAKINERLTPSRFDRVMHTQTVAVECTVQTCNKSQQTEHDSQDLYTRLSKLFSCLCTEHGVQGCILVEGIGSIEMKLTKTEQIDLVEAAAKDGRKFEVLPQKSLAEISCQTDQHMLRCETVDKSVGTDLERFVDVGAEVSPVEAKIISEISSSHALESASCLKMKDSIEAKAVNGEQKLKDDLKKSPLESEPAIDSEVLVMASQEDDQHWSKFDFSTIIDSSQEHLQSITNTLEDAVKEATLNSNVAIEETQLDTDDEKPEKISKTQKKIRCLVDSSDEDEAAEQKASEKVTKNDGKKKKPPKIDDIDEYLASDDDSALNAALDTIDMSIDASVESLPPTPPNQVHSEDSTL